MADSYHKRIMAVIFAALQGITIENGYRTDIGLRAFHWKSTAFAPEEMPGVNLRDVSTNYADATIGGNAPKQRVTTIEVIVAVAEGSQSADAMNDARDDVMKALAIEGDLITQFSGISVKLQPAEEQKQIEQADRVYAVVMIRYTLKFRTLSADPSSVTP